MKTKRFDVNWQSVLLGMALCLVLVVFVSSKVAAPQDPGGAVQQSRVLQRAANVNDVWEKTTAMDARLIAMDERLVRMELKIDELGKDMKRVQKALDRLETGKTGK